MASTANLSWCCDSAEALKDYEDILKETDLVDHRMLSALAWKIWLGTFVW